MKRALSSLASLPCNMNYAHACSRGSKRPCSRQARTMGGSRFLSSEKQHHHHPDGKKEVLSETEQKENIRWAVGFFGVIVVANVFTVWQEWNALTGNKTEKVSNGLEDIDLVSDDTKTKLPKFSY